MLLTEEAVQAQVSRPPAERQQLIAAREESWMALSWDRKRFSSDDAKTTLTILSAIAFSDYKEPIDLSHLSDEATSSRDAASSAEQPPAPSSSANAKQPSAHHTPARAHDANALNTSSSGGRITKKDASKRPSSKRERRIKPKRLNPKPSKPTIPAKSIVACLVRSAEPDMWVLGRVERYIPESKEYEVMDHDNDSEEQRYLVKYEDLRVIPPKRLKFDRNKPVLAVYPKTTVFYKAHLKEPKRGNCWAVEFEDDYYDSNKIKEVESRFILQDPGCIS